MPGQWNNQLAKAIERENNPAFMDTLEEKGTNNISGRTLEAYCYKNGRAKRWNKVLYKLYGPQELARSHTIIKTLLTTLQELFKLTHKHELTKTTLGPIPQLENKEPAYLNPPIPGEQPPKGGWTNWREWFNAGVYVVNVFST
jgi:hypothetical protein